MSETTRPRRRAPEPTERKVDAERSRRLLLEAALDEFSAKGFAGARVQDIADRAGVNKQLINYYFGGKEGLYRAIGRRWLEREAEFNDPAVPLDELMVRYLRHALDDPRGSRLNVWRGLTEDADRVADEIPEEFVEDLSDMERRKAEGQIADDLDPAAVMLLMMSAVAAPVVMPLAVRRVFGVSATSPEFQDRYADQLRRIIRRLAASPQDTRPPGTGDAPTS
ncbi:TetR/AcrR family transcriptional regulator [Actinomadura terrae]|uniref:TetR/AcrR family transcriptional regulator n=1 Tax=Actinomadura terrae TaxID=604353 RepID=UPI001FA6CD54|nr:TetR family transcriptional regulator [Actinomadura terrae]